jgi:hypothetical protein
MNKQQYVILTIVEMSENSYGLQDYNFPFKAEEVFITFLNETITLKNSLLAYNNNGRLTNPLINSWIQNNSLDRTSEPVKLIFQKQRTGNSYHYILYRSQGNYIYNYLNQELEQ